MSQMAPASSRRNAAESHSFTSMSTVSGIRRSLAEADDQLPAELIDDDDDKEEYFTEAMAAVYIKQHKFEQALEIIKAISADNPKKSVYFAEQIRYLELLVRLNRNKK